MKILDCTLRDGGYYTNWDFDESIVGLYFESMNKLPVDIIEFGYRSIPKDEYLGKYFYCPDFVLKQAKKMVPDKVLAIMLNEKDCEPDELETLLKPCRGIIQLVRIAVAPARIEKGIELAKAVKAKGFSVALNLMYVSTLSEQPEFFNKIKGIEAVVDYFNLVDSYGGIYPADVEKLVLQCKAKTKVTLGFHGHNNIELAFSNSLAAIKAGCEIVDATITGMGRGAGNLKTELMLTHLATKHHVNVDFNSLSNVTAAFSELQKKYEWGTNLPYMVSGANSLPQKDIILSTAS
jgi:4-hydroxy 2-oxovalerate aldolase